MRVTCEKKGDNLEFHISQNGEDVIVELYRPAGG